MSDVMLMDDMMALLPELVSALGLIGLMVYGAFKGHAAFGRVLVLSALMFAGLGVYAMCHMYGVHARVLSDALIVDGFAMFGKAVIAFGAAYALMLARGQATNVELVRFEYPVLVGFSTLGMFVLVSANDFLSLYMGLELSSLPLYVLAAFARNDGKSAEAGLKYFVLGALSSGLFLFGASLIYGYTGALGFDVVRATMASAALPGPMAMPLMAVFGMVLVLAGLAFKIAAVPFHMWSPDVYEGAPTSITAFFAMVPKFAAMLVLLRVVGVPFAGLGADIMPILWLMALLSMVVGAFGGIVQANIKRLMAYSSIANAGYALIGVSVLSHMGFAAAIVYGVVYMVMVGGVFAFLMLLRKDGAPVQRIADLAGLAKTHPLLAYGMAGLMFALAGVPPMAGFFSKLVVFEAAVAAEFYWLVVLGVALSVVAAWYYLNIVRVMFFNAPPVPELAPQYVPTRIGIALVVLALLFAVGFVFMPNGLIVAAAKVSSGFVF